MRDEKGEPLVWVVQMESAAQAFKDGITRESFPQGTVFSMGVHPRRDGKPAGDRGESGSVSVPEGQEAGARQALRLGGGRKAFGEGELPAEGPSRADERFHIDSQVSSSKSLIETER